LSHERVNATTRFGSEIGGSGTVLHAFVYSEVAVLVRHWFEIGRTDSHLEHGARIEVRLRAPQPQRGTYAAAQAIVADQPLFRADLFDRVGGVPGGFEAAHFHPSFIGVEPCQRTWADEVKKTPWDWLHRRLSDIPDIVATAGAKLAEPDAERAAVAADAAMIVEVAQGRAGSECRSTVQCHAWTRDAASAVRLMVADLERPDLLDRDRVAPWLGTAA
jgi:hypothetical protein